MNKAKPYFRSCYALLVLASLALLSGCASYLPAKAIQLEKASCEQSSDACLQQGKQLFERYRQTKVALIQQKSDGFRLPSAPVGFFHPHRTRYSALLVHGLNDSAFYMADIAEALYQHGLNVVTVLLPGHGTTTRDMLDASAEQWRAEVERGLEMASLVGDSVLLGGFSLGAALAIDAIGRQADVDALLLFSPAIKLRSFSSLSNFSCAPLIRSITIETDIPVNPVKYKYRVGNSLCQLNRIIRSNLSPTIHGDNTAVTFLEKTRATASRIMIPTFTALSYADVRIDPWTVLDFTAHIDAPVTIATFGVAGDKQYARPFKNAAKVIHIDDHNLAHSYLVRRTNSYNQQMNPHFDSLVSLMMDFLDENVLNHSR